MDKTKADIAIANLVDANENALDYNKEDIKTVREYIRDTIRDLADLATMLEERNILDLLFDDTRTLLVGLDTADNGAEPDWFDGWEDELTVDDE